MSVKRLLSALLLLMVSAQFAHAQGVSNAQARKPVVAVYELKDLANTGQAEAFLAMVQTAITTTNRFRVIERNFAVLAAEQNNANSGMVTTRTPGRRGGFEGADFLIYGTITQGQDSQRTDTGCKLGMALLGLAADCKQNSAALGIDIRIVDSKTGQLRWAKQIRQEAKGKVMVAGESRVDYMALFRGAAQNIATGLTLALYPVKVAAVQPDGTVMLNMGGDVLRTGDYLQIYGKQTACIPDPDTGECLTSDGEVLGTILVYETQDKFSRARPLVPFVQVPAPGAIARLTDPPPPPSKKKKGRN